MPICFLRWRGPLQPAFSSSSGWAWGVGVPHGEPLLSQAGPVASGFVCLSGGLSRAPGVWVGGGVIPTPPCALCCPGRFLRALQAGATAESVRRSLGWEGFLFHASPHQNLEFTRFNAGVCEAGFGAGPRDLFCPVRRWGVLWAFIVYSFSPHAGAQCLLP